MMAIGVLTQRNVRASEDVIGATTMIAKMIVKGALIKTVSRNALSKHHRRRFFKINPLLYGN
ncbi:hypothetical protein C7W93_12125 [Glaciimonas sp. PCH181]|nr:hypothetical protein C7W93_12125 [Glaciimonas sp. PCH181]